MQLWPGDCAPSLAEGATRLGTWVPFERLPEMLHRFTGTRLSASTIQRVTEMAGAAAEALQTAAVERLERDLPAPPAGPAVQQASVDGAMVPLRGKGEWAEVKTLAIGTVQTPVLTKEGELEVHVTDLSYCSRLTDHATFTRLATVETHRRGMETAGMVCGVVDGADWCQQCFDTQRPDAVRILDFSHAAGYLAQIAQTAFGPGTVGAAGWLETQRHALKHGTPAAVLDTLRTLQAAVAARSDGAVAAEAIAKCLAYFEKRQAQLCYATFQQQGYPIGSGIVERANKLVVEARLKGAGMHWERAHVNPMRALRTIACADRWDEAWPQIVHQVRAPHRTVTAQRRDGRRARSRMSAPPVPTVEPTTIVEPPPCLPRAAEPRRPPANHPWRRSPIGCGSRIHASGNRGARI